MLDVRTHPSFKLIKDNALRKAKRKKDLALWKEAKLLRNDYTQSLRNARADYIKENLVLLESITSSMDYHIQLY